MPEEVNAAKPNDEAQSIREFLHYLDDDVQNTMTGITMAFRQDNVPYKFTLSEVHAMADLAHQMIEFEKEGT